MKKFDIITIGGAVADITFYTNQGRVFRTPQDLTAQKMLGFEYGAKVNIAEARCTVGGGAANVAASLAKLGFKVGALLRVGNDFNGAKIKEELKKRGVAVDLIQTDNFLQTGFSFILVTDKKSHEHIAFLHRGANVSLDTGTAALKNSAAKYFYLTSLSGSSWAGATKNIFNYARKQQIKIIWNPGNLQLQAGKHGLEKFLKQTEILILNKDEAIELALSGVKIGRRDPKFLNRPVYLLNILNEWGPKIVVITEGQKGAYAFKDGKIYNTKSINKKEVDTTGVGDAFGAAFLGGLLYSKTMDIKTGFVWGILNSANVLTEVGAQNGILSRQELLEKAKKVK